MTLREHLRKEPFTLALSSGFFGFFAHCGVALALGEENLHPAKVTGSSAGAIVASAIAHDVSLGDLKSTFRELKKSHFWDPSIGVGILRGEKMEGLVREILQGRPRKKALAISVFDIFARKTKSFDDGDIPRLVRASCAVPMMFHPVRHEGRYYWDGGILDKMALAGVGRRERVLVNYLPGEAYERNHRRDFASLAPNQGALVIRGLPAPGPDALERGLQAVDVAYECAREALGRSIRASNTFV
jgi:NTE family protein